MKKRRPKDFVEEIVAERTTKNPAFPGLVEEASTRRRKYRSRLGDRPIDRAAEILLDALANPDPSAALDTPESREAAAEARRAKRGAGKRK